MSLTILGLGALGVAAGRAHDSYIAGTDIISGVDDDTSAQQAARYIAVQQAAPRLKTTPDFEPDTDMPLSTIVTIASVLTLAGLSVMFWPRRRAV